MKTLRRVFVLGGGCTAFIGKRHPDYIWKGHPDFGKRQNPTIDELTRAAVDGALASAGIGAESVEKIVFGNFAGELFVNQGHMGALVARVNAAFDGKPATRVEAACASGGLAVLGAVEAIQSGREVVLAVGAEVQTSVSPRDGADFLARASHYASERSIDDFTFPAMFARRACFYKQATGCTDERIAHVVAKAYSNANRNPLAHMKAVRVTLEQASRPSDANPLFLANPEYREHMKISDCSQVSDGAAAMILVSEEALRRLGKKPDDCVEIVSYGHSTGALGKVADFTRLDITHRAASEAYRDAGIGPSDVGVAEVHDCFSVTEVMMVEALGFADFGHGWKLAAEGRSTLSGDIPVNPGGGLLAFGHPVGATGVKQVWEVARQMKGACGDYQVARRPRFGITANMGGDDRTAVCFVVRAP